MSTKSSIYCDDNMHVYSDCNDEGPLMPVYIDAGFGGNSVSVSLSPKAAIAIWNEVDNWVQWARKNAAKTDEEIERECREFVAKRPREGIGVMAAYMQYGDAKRPDDEQIADGIASITEFRERCKEQLKLLAEDPFKTGEAP